MSLTNKQKMLLHRVASQLGIDDEQRRIIQRNVGGFHSAADKTASHEGFAAVMAFYEDRAGGTLPGYTPAFWKAAHERNKARDGVSTDRLIWQIRRVAKTLGWPANRIDTFLHGPHMSSGAANNLETANAYWLHRLLDAMKTMAARRAL